MNPFNDLMSDYEKRGCAVHWLPGIGFIAAVGKAFGRALYRIHPLDDFAGLPDFVLGKVAALAALDGEGK